MRRLSTAIMASLVSTWFAASDASAQYGNFPHVAHYYPTPAPFGPRLLPFDPIPFPRERPMPIEPIVGPVRLPIWYQPPVWHPEPIWYPPPRPIGQPIPVWNPEPILFPQRQPIWNPPWYQPPIEPRFWPLFSPVLERPILGTGQPPLAYLPVLQQYAQQLSAQQQATQQQTALPSFKFQPNQLEP